MKIILTGLILLLFTSTFSQKRTTKLPTLESIGWTVNYKNPMQYPLDSGYAKYLVKLNNQGQLIDIRLIESTLNERAEKSCRNSILWAQFVKSTNADSEKHHYYKGTVLIRLFPDIPGSEDTTTANDNPRFTIVEQAAYFPGGREALFDYIGEKIKFPRDARKNNITGKVVVEFMIDETGNIPEESIKVTESLYKSCDEEAIRLIKECPRWVPGQQWGKPVKQKMRLPITFK